MHADLRLPASYPALVLDNNTLHPPVKSILPQAPWASFSKNEELGLASTDSWPDRILGRSKGGGRIDDARSLAEWYRSLTDQKRNGD